MERLKIKGKSAKLYRLEKGRIKKIILKILSKALKNFVTLVGSVILQVLISKNLRFFRERLND
ncbi:MAG: hypothetical protein ISS77_05240 [Phycisphaerae bacterium]|nr:hypothetical protein [Phycisphaerae bacterium]